MWRFVLGFYPNFIAGEDRRGGEGRGEERREREGEGVVERG